MDQNSDKDDYALSLVEDGELFPTEPENPSTIPPHEETAVVDAPPKRTIKPTVYLLVLYIFKDATNFWLQKLYFLS